MRFYLVKDGAVAFSGAPHIYTEHIEPALSADELEPKQQQASTSLRKISKHPNIIFMEPGVVVNKDFFGKNAHSALRFHTEDTILEIADNFLGTKKYVVVVSNMFYVDDTFYSCFLVSKSNIERKIRLHLIDDLLSIL